MGDMRKKELLTESLKKVEEARDLLADNNCLFDDFDKDVTDLSAPFYELIDAIHLSDAMMAEREKNG